MKKIVNLISLCTVAFVLLVTVLPAKADPCNGPCVREVQDCQPKGSKCSGSGNQCGVEQSCKGGELSLADA